MNTGVALIVTSINPPGPVLRALARGASAASIEFIVAGDTKSPGISRSTGAAS